jgi:hypothetical protein
MLAYSSGKHKAPSPVQLNVPMLAVVFSSCTLPHPSTKPGLTDCSRRTLQTLTSASSRTQTAGITHAAKFLPTEPHPHTLFVSSLHPTTHCLPTDVLTSISTSNTDEVRIEPRKQDKTEHPAHLPPDRVLASILHAVTARAGSPPSSYACNLLPTHPAITQRSTLLTAHTHSFISMRLSTRSGGAC